MGHKVRNLKLQTPSSGAENFQALEETGADISKDWKKSAGNVYEFGGSTGRFRDDVLAECPELDLRIIEAGDPLPKKMEGMEDRNITFPVGEKKMTLKGADYLFHFSMPNFYFHVSAAYNILRHNGLQIGKDDFIGSQ